MWANRTFHVTLLSFQQVCDNHKYLVLYVRLEIAIIILLSGINSMILDNGRVTKEEQHKNLLIITNSIRKSEVQKKNANLEVKMT